MASSDSFEAPYKGEVVVEQNSYTNGDFDHETLTHQQQIDRLAEKYDINQTKLMRKLDFRIIPAICFLYLLAFLDRVNISNANVYGLSKDLNLEGHQYNTALTIFFVPYILAEIPSNWLMKKLQPHKWLSGCMVLFGVVTLGMGFVTNFGQLCACRFLLGLFEAGMFPGCFYLLSMWYRREEAQKRYSFFFSSTCLAGAFGGLIASGINNMDGTQGYESWRWIFILEGAATAGIALLMYFVISDFPEDAKFLTDNERAFMKEKLAVGSVASNFERKMTFSDVKFIFSDWKIWLAGIMYFGLIVPAYGYAYFATEIVKSLGHSPLQTQFRSVPPWVAAFGFSMAMAVVSDKIRHKFALTVASGVICIVGFIVILTETENTSVRYGALFMIASGAYTAMPLIVCWTNLNFGGTHRRSVATAYQVAFGNIGGIIATFSYMKADAPLYKKGLAIGVGFTALSMIACCIYMYGVYRDNQKKRTQEYVDNFNAMSDEKRDMAGELEPSFVYSY